MVESPDPPPGMLPGESLDGGLISTPETRQRDAELKVQRMEKEAREAKDMLHALRNTIAEGKKELAGERLKYGKTLDGLKAATDAQLEQTVKSMSSFVEMAKNLECERARVDELRWMVCRLTGSNAIQPPSRVVKVDTYSGGPVRERQCAPIFSDGDGE